MKCESCGNWTAPEIIHGYKVGWGVVWLCDECGWSHTLSVHDSEEAATAALAQWQAGDGSAGGVEVERDLRDGKVGR